MLAIRQNKNEATAKDWADLQADLSAHQAELENTKILVYTDGGTLTAPQRKELMAVLGDSHALVATVSDSMKVRFAGSTISLFQKNYKQFTTAELGQAYEHCSCRSQSSAKSRLCSRILKRRSTRTAPNRARPTDQQVGVGDSTSDRGRGHNRFSDAPNRSRSESRRRRASTVGRSAASHTGHPAARCRS